MKSIIQFLSGVRTEFSKVVWPKKAEFIGSIVVVLFLVFVFALYLSMIDFGFSKLTSYIYGIYGL